MKGWLLRHLQSALFAAGRLARSPMSTAFTVLVSANGTRLRRPSVPLARSNSGTITSSLRTSFSMVGASVQRPGISTPSATHTRASSSHAAWM